ncbi:Tcc1i14-2.7 [Trypanosoma grayi]|uniref:Tcc1i14-2.7 n=1 Tax=Trypanosoma grayi TaxID=71804 RepID=UPI0004F44048|nr:Tcc1i14-2.7 [Trypanosoma grayi]KEG11629.1 Tcc1i14-2.7 [Trypanosoma grayi]
MSPLSVMCERQTTSFTKAFKKRYVTFDRESRKLSYAEDDSKPPKGVIIVTKVVRCCQVMKVKAAELLTLMIDGNHEDGRADQWTLRMPTLQLFEEWNETLWTACAGAGLMEPYNYGLPPVDPRSNLPFAQVPLQHLFKFSGLEKMVIHFFGAITLLSSTVAKDTQSPHHVLVVGDRAIYVFNLNATVIYCSLISHIRKLHHGPEATFFALQLRPPAPDIVVKDFSGAVQVASVVGRLYQVATGKKLNIMPINVPTAEVLVESQQLRLSAGEGYKLQMVPPSTKLRLRQAIDAKRDETDADAYGNSDEKPQTGNGATADSSTYPDSADPLTKLLHGIGLSQYAPTLLSQHVDLDVLKCMDASDLNTFGVMDKSHCQKILEAALRSEMDFLGVGNGNGNASATPPTGVANPAAGGIALSDDDDDDDLVLPATRQKSVSLDDDSDVELPAKKAPAANAAKPAITIVDDDDL